MVRRGRALSGPKALGRHQKQGTHRPSARGQAPAAAAANNASTAGSTNVHQGQAQYPAGASRRRGVSTAPRQMSAPWRSAAAEATGSRCRQSSTRGRGPRGEAASLVARPRPPPRPPPRGGRRQGMPRRRRASLPQTSRRLEAPGSPTPRRWRGASEWCWLAWTELLSPRSQPAIKKIMKKSDKKCFEKKKHF